MTELLANRACIEGILNLRGTCPACGYETVALIPLRAGDAILGLLQFNNVRKQTLSERKILLLERLADNFAIALARLRAEEALQTAHAELERRVAERTSELMAANLRLNLEIEERKRTETELQKSNRLLTALSNLQSHYIAGTHPRILFKEILDNLLSLTASEHGFIAEVMRSPAGTPYLKTHAITDCQHSEANGECDETKISREFEFHNLQTLYGAVITTGRALISNSPAQDPRSSGIPEGHSPLHSFLGLPLHSGGELIGVLGLANKPGGYNDELIEYLHPLLMSFGNVLGGHRHDLARRAAEEALRESEKRFRHIYDHAPVMMHLLDQDGRLISVNLKWLEETGYTRKEVIGEQLDFLLSPGSAGENLSTVLSRLWNEGFVRNIPHQFVRKDGNIIDVMLDGNVTVEPSGKKVALTALKNITERRRAEEQLRKSKATLQMVFDGITEPLIMFDKDMRVRMINRAAKDYANLERYEEALGKPCFEGLWGRTAPCEACERPFSHLDDFTGSFERKSPLDSKRLERVDVYRVKDEPCDDAASIMQISDITQSKQMERQLIQSEKLASLGLLISGIAHEINNPNNFISFNIPILKDYLNELVPIIDEHADRHADFKLFGMSYQEFREDIFKLIENMEHGSTRINRTVSGLKEYVRRRDEVERHEVNIAQVVERKDL